MTGTSPDGLRKRNNIVTSHVKLESQVQTSYLALTSISAF